MIITMDRLDKLFSSELGKKIFSEFLRAISDFNMQPLIDGGVLIGLSGGADSVMLLCLLLEYRRRTRFFNITALHVNHMIRGVDADEDEEFSSQLCESFGIEFLSEKINVPKMAKATGVGLEECARNVRYSKFAELIRGRNDINALAIAHNANDNLETVLSNIIRGTGTRGAAGIPPIRDNIIRPMIYVKKVEIVRALEFAGISYVTDKTNFENDYKRNFLRNEIVSRLESKFESVVDMATRLSSNLRCDDDFITVTAEKFIDDNNPITLCALRSLHKAVFIRVISILSDGASLSSLIIDDVYDLIKRSDKFSYSLPGGKRFIAEAGICKIVSIRDEKEYDYRFEISSGKNELSGFDADFFVFGEKLDKESLNIYKISIYADISSAIIEGNLHLRPRREGDTVFYGGITRKIKKLYSDRKIPPSVRDSIPLLCDGKGVVWVPGFGVRDDIRCKSEKNPCYVALAIGKSDEMFDYRLHSGSEYKS